MYEDTPEDKILPREKSKCPSTKSSSLVSIPSTTSVYSERRKKWSSSIYELRQQIFNSTWGGYALDLDLWEDSKSPVVHSRSSEILLDDRESYGFLSDRLIGLGSSFLTRSPESGLYVLSKCVLKNKNLTDITILQYHRHLQYINIAHNKVSFLSPLSSLPYLMYLNASHNKLKRVSNFTAPWYLTCVNLSWNNIVDVGDLKNCWSIVRLNLSHNVIENISGLEQLKHLQYLDLSYNLIECVKNLDDLKVRELNLEGNCITSFKFTQGRVLPNLRTIMLGYNRLSILRFFKKVYTLRFVDLKFNKISDLLEVLNLKGSTFEVDLRGNACTKWPNYRNVLVSSIPNLKVIDGIEVFAAEKVTSAMLFSSPLDLTAARKIAKLTLLEQLNISKVEAHVQPYDEINPPLLILTGPSALRKLALAFHVAETLPDKIKICSWHTTKKIYEDDEHHKSYIPVDREDFNDMARRGEFIVILDLLGDSYGFHVSQISSLISEKKIGLTQMNLFAAMEISKRYLNVKPILVLSHCTNLHRDWIREKFEIYTWIKDSVEDLLVVKLGEHREEEEVETASSILHYIKEILNEILCSLEFPPYSFHVRPQDRATTIDIMLESKMMLPKVVVERRRTAPWNEKYITISEKKTKSLDQLLSEEKQAMDELKVLLDEKANIYIDDEETKQEQHRSKMFHRRDALITKTFEDLDEDDVDESTTLSEKTTEMKLEEKSEKLKNTYIDLVIKSRKVYLDYHESHPGFFVLVLLMDDYMKAFNSLIDFVNELYTSQSFKQPTLLSEINSFKETVFSDMIQDIINEIREDLSVSKLQQKAVLKLQGTDSRNSLTNSRLSINSETRDILSFPPCNNQEQKVSMSKNLNIYFTK